MRRPFLLTLVFVCLAGISTAVPARAATLIFLQVEGIQGESIDEGHENWIALTSFSHGLARPCGQESDFSEFVFTKELDRATPKLYFAVDAAQIHEQITVHVQQSGGSDNLVILEYVFQNVLFHAGATSHNNGGDRPWESWSFSYGQVEITYNRIDPVGSETVTLTVGPCSPH